MAKVEERRKKERKKAVKGFIKKPKLTPVHTHAHVQGCKGSRRVPLCLTLSHGKGKRRKREGR